MGVLFWISAVVTIFSSSLLGCLGVYCPVTVLNKTQRCWGWRADQDLCHDPQNLLRGGSQRHIQSRQPFLTLALSGILDKTAMQNIENKIFAITTDSGQFYVWILSFLAFASVCLSVSFRNMVILSIAWSSKISPQGKVKDWATWDTTNHPKLPSL